MKRIEVYQTESGKEPFTEWIKRFDKKTEMYIDKYISRVAKGGSKKHIRNLGDGVSEIKMPKGPGYRVYFAEVEDIIILLLIGGDKGSQKQDILKAKKYWSEYHV